MKMTNYEIYTCANALVSWKPEIKMPVKINFFLQKNINMLIGAAREIEEAKMQVASQFGVEKENNQLYSIPKEQWDEALRELNDLFSLEQDIPLYIFKLNDFENIELTMNELSPIIFMIQE